MVARREEISDPDLLENVFMKVRKRIEVIFDSLIEKVNERRETFLGQLNEWEEEFNRTRASHFQALEKIKRERNEIEALLSKLTIGTARNAMEKGIEELTETINKKGKQIEYPRIRFVCDTRTELELNFAKFGTLTEETNNALVRNYSQLSKPLKVFGTFGSRKAEFSRPRGVVMDSNSQRIFIADSGNSRIQVWSMEGDYLSEFGKGVFHDPWEIVLFDDSIYISDCKGNFLSKWCLSTFALVKKSETPPGAKPGQLISPSGLDIDEGEVFVVEYFNNRISVFDLDLKFNRIIADNVISYSNCLRVRNNLIYIVESTGTIKLFSKEDQLLKTIPKLSFFRNICHFNLDSQLNFLLTCSNNSLFFISPDGDLIHSINSAEFGLKSPFGIGVSMNGRVSIAFQEGVDVIAIF